MHIFNSSSQASARSGTVGNTVSALTAQSAFLNNFENVVNHRVDIREDIKRYQDTLSYASSKVDCSVRENIYMLPSDMNLKFRSGTVGYNNKILVSDEKFKLGKNEKVNLMVPAIKSHKVTQTATNSNDVLPPHGSHAPMKKLLCYWLWQVVLPYGIFFDELVITILYTAVCKILYDS